MTARTLLAPLLCAGALALPVAADAAPALSTSAVCAASNTDVMVTGTGFSPNANVTVTQNAGPPTSFATDATGMFTADLTAPKNATFKVLPTTVTATDAQGLTATLTYGSITDVFATNFPINGKPTQRALWQFVGFTPGKAIYGHYRYRSHTVADYRFGVARAPCGTLNVVAKRLPVTSHAGDWTVQFDQSPKYSRFTKPRRPASFTISRG